MYCRAVVMPYFIACCSHAGEHSVLHSLMWAQMPLPAVPCGMAMTTMTIMMIHLHVFAHGLDRVLDHVLDRVLDRVLDHGLDRGLDRGLDHVLDRVSDQ